MRSIIKTGRVRTPELLRTRSPFMGILSRNWALSGGTQRIGAALIGILCAAGGIACIMGVFRIKGEVEAAFIFRPFVDIFTFVIVFGVLLVGLFGLAFGFRLLQGAIFSKSRSKI
jgi:hypothetical protein